MLDPLPKILPGTVCEQWIRCGKPTCHCARGHGPYFCRFWREKGRLRKAYVPRHQTREVTERCQARQEREQEMRSTLQDWRSLGQTLRDAERSR